MSFSCQPSAFSYQLKTRQRAEPLCTNVTRKEIGILGEVLAGLSHTERSVIYARLRADS